MSASEIDKAIEAAETAVQEAVRQVAVEHGIPERVAGLEAHEALGKMLYSPGKAPAYRIALFRALSQRARQQRVAAGDGIDLHHFVGPGRPLRQGTLDLLERAGIYTSADVRAATDAELLAIPGVSKVVVQALRLAAGDNLPPPQAPGSGDDAA